MSSYPYKLTKLTKVFYLFLLWIPIILTGQLFWVFVPGHRFIIAILIFFAFLIFGHKIIPLRNESGNIVLWVILYSFFAYNIFWFPAALFTKHPSVTWHFLGSLDTRVIYFIVIVSAFLLFFPVDDFWKYFSFYSVIVTSLSLILFVLLASGFSLPYTRFGLTDLSSRGEVFELRHFNYYIGFATTVLPFSGNKTFIRIQGFNNEGGSYALFILPFLVYLESFNKSFKFKNLFINILRLGVFFSFSLGGWLSYLLFMSMRLVFEKRKSRYLLRMVSIILGLTLIGVSLYTFFPDANSIIDSLLFERALSASQSSINMEHTRVVGFKECNEVFLENPIIGVGPGQTAFIKMIESSVISSIWSDNGILGSALFFLPWILLLLIALKMALKGEPIWFYILVTHLSHLLHRGSLTGFLDFLIAATIVVSYRAFSKSNKRAMYPPNDGAEQKKGMP